MTRVAAPAAGPIPEWDLGKVTIVVAVDNASEEPARVYLRGLQQTERRVRVIFNDATLGCSLCPPQLGPARR